MKQVAYLDPAESGGPDLSWTKERRLTETAAPRDHLPHGAEFLLLPPTLARFVGAPAQIPTVARTTRTSG